MSRSGRIAQCIRLGERCLANSCKALQSVAEIISLDSENDREEAIVAVVV
jgi:hypothetical protein